jgi:hypothetical protein
MKNKFKQCCGFRVICCEVIKNAKCRQKTDLIGRKLKKKTKKAPLGWVFF